MTTTVNTNDIAAVETKFLTSMGNGVIATAHLATLIHDAKTSDDSRHIASVVNKLVKKGDANGSRGVRQVFAAIFTGANFAKSKDKKSIVLKMKGVKLDADALARLDAAVADNLSIRDALVKRVKGDTDKAPTELPKSVTAYLKRMEKDGFSKAAVIAAMQAA